VLVRVERGVGMASSGEEAYKHDYGASDNDEKDGHDQDADAGLFDEGGTFFRRLIVIPHHPAP